MQHVQFRPTAKPVNEITSYRHERLIQRHAQDHEVTLTTAEERFAELKKFMTVCAMKPGPKISSPQVDLMWHSFLLYTKDYAQFCSAYLGRFINHAPFEESNPQAYLDTRTTVEAVFGPLDARLWPIDAQADCTSGCSD